MIAGGAGRQRGRPLAESARSGPARPPALARHLGRAVRAHRQFPAERGWRRARVLPRDPPTPGTRWGVILSAADSIEWLARLFGTEGARRSPPPSATASASRRARSSAPYLSGERTPHNDGGIRGAFAGARPRGRPAGDDPRRCLRAWVSPCATACACWPKPAPRSRPPGQSEGGAALARLAAHHRVDPRHSAPACRRASPRVRPMARRGSPSVPRPVPIPAPSARRRRSRKRLIPIVRSPRPYDESYARFRALAPVLKEIAVR